MLLGLLLLLLQKLPLLLLRMLLGLVLRVLLLQVLLLLRLLLRLLVLVLVLVLVLLLLCLRLLGLLRGRGLGGLRGAIGCLRCKVRGLEPPPRCRATLQDLVLHSDLSGRWWGRKPDCRRRGLSSLELHVRSRQIVSEELYIQPSLPETSCCCLRAYHEPFVLLVRLALGLDRIDQSELRWSAQYQAGACIFQLPFQVGPERVGVCHASCNAALHTFKQPIDLRLQCGGRGLHGRGCRRGN